jgi:glycosyltransferase involved in cell wall biosynthesis
VKELAVYQKACDIMLMPFPQNEHYSYYMSPLKMFEYMASKRPIIATNLPSIKEILNDSNSLLINPGAPEELVNAIEKLKLDKNLGQKLSDQAYQDALKYTWFKRVENIIKFIKSKNKKYCN